MHRSKFIFTVRIIVSLLFFNINEYEYLYTLFHNVKIYSREYRSLTSLVYFHFWFLQLFLFQPTNPLSESTHYFGRLYNQFSFLTPISL